jgi:hypothetical protein
MQGRLSPPVDDHYQEFPKNWKQEFSLLEDLQLNGVEWLITKKHYKDNPIFLALEDKEKYHIHSICMDNLVDTKISEDLFLQEMLDEFCFKISGKFSGYLTIPLLDESDLSDAEKRHKFCSNIQKIGKKYPDIKFAFETEMSIDSLQEIVELCDNFYVTYDTGNTTSFGLDHRQFITHFAEKIVNVHIKDRTYESKTVEPLTGDTDFNIIFQFLKNINYSGAFILQTARGESNKEVQTIQKHKIIFEKLYAEYF